MRQPRIRPPPRRCFAATSVTTGTLDRSLCRHLVPCPRLCSPPGVGRDLQNNVSLVVAALDLQLVRLLRGAIRTADLSSRPGGAGGAGGAFGPAAVIEPR